MIELIRDSLSEKGTHGIFELNGDFWNSMEQPDLGNRPFESCVPQGEYELRPFTSPRYGECFIMVNEDLNVYEFKDSPGRPDEGRFLCLFVHRGNWPRNFQGCIGAGFRYLEEKDMITRTVKACKLVNAGVRDEGSYRLTIRHEFE